MNAANMTSIYNWIANGATNMATGANSRRGIMLAIMTFVASVMILAPLSVSASDTLPNHIDQMDQAYLAEYEERAAEKYATFLAMQAKTELATEQDASDWGGELFVVEYQQFAQEQYDSLMATLEEEEQPNAVVSTE